MIASNPNSKCEQARPYYYGYLFGEGEKHFPAEVLAHVSQCGFCQDEVNRLKIVLDKSEEHAAQNTRQVNSTVITNLRLHFAYIGASVTCNTVRPFLPSLADPLLFHAKQYQRLTFSTTVSPTELTQPMTNMLNFASRLPRMPAAAQHA